VRLLTCDSWDRKGDDIKGVINEIAEILDEKHVHWTRRVGDCLGKSRPSGQIRVFVGDTIVNALWPVIAVTEEISASDSSTSAEHS
jgi:hypothetical protein